MTIPESYKVDFSPCRKDLIQQGIDRLLSQHYDKCALKQFLLAIMGEVQELYDAIIDMQEKRTLYHARGETLEALGRIVGEPRAAYTYDESGWMFADRAIQGTDNTESWCLHGPFAKYVAGSDSGYKMNILTRIIKNHTLTSSIPELERLTSMITETAVSYEKTGPMQVNVLVPKTITPTDWHILTQAQSDRRADHVFMLPYPATLWFDMVIVFLPEELERSGWFCADRTNKQRCDRARCAVGAPREETGGNIGLPEYGGGTGGVFVPDVWLCVDRENDQRPDYALCAVGVPHNNRR